jgi:hypothetical protein
MPLSQAMTSQVHKCPNNGTENKLGWNISSIKNETQKPKQKPQLNSSDQNSPLVSMYALNFSKMLDSVIVKEIQAVTKER